jgi:dipeptidyl aminopeptidase/acylaminoacyl peptidase
MKNEANFLNLESLLRIPYVDPDLGFDLSQDGKKVAFSWNKTGQWEIFIKELDNDTQADQITDGMGGKFAPRWRPPDGTQLAYALDVDGSENYDIYAYDLETAAHINLTPNSHEAISPIYSWSPDGQQIAYCSNREGHFDTYTMAIVDGESKKILNNAYQDCEVSWSPDGKYLSVVSETRGQDHWTTIVPLDGNIPFIISLDGSPICANNPSWSPDSTQIAFSSNHHGKYEIGIFDIHTGVINWLTGGKGEKKHPLWMIDDHLIYIKSYGPSCRLVLYSLGGRSVTDYQIEPGVIYKPKLAPQGDGVLFAFDNPRFPCDLWKLSIPQKTFQQITRSLPNNVIQDKFKMPLEIYYPSFDGEAIPALLYQTSEDSHLPAVIYVHGGPNWLTQITWDPLIQHMVNRGWVVLAPNYRGSTGYGKDWQIANRHDLGGVDLLDVVAGADFLSCQGIVDPNKIAVTGRSWGGYLTALCLTHYSDKWVAGSAVVPFLNWFTSHSNARIDLKNWDLENFGSPITHQQVWYERSPYFFLDQVQAPIQLICGAQDIRCPASESSLAYEKLLEYGKDCEYHLYPDEGHSFLRTENRIKSEIQRVNFLARYLES